MSEVLGGLRANLTHPVLLLSVLLLLLLGGMIGAFWLAQAQERHQARYAELVLEQGQLAREITDVAQRAATGEADGHDRLRRLADQFAHNLQLLRDGDRQRDVPPLPAAHAAALQGLTNAWRVERVNIEAILAGRGATEALLAAVQTMDEAHNELLDLTIAVADALRQREAPPVQVHLADRQPWHLERARAALERMRLGDGVVAPANDLAAAAGRYATVLAGLRAGSEALAVEAVDDAEAAAMLARLAERFAPVATASDHLLDLTSELELGQQAAGELDGALAPLVARLEQSISAVVSRDLILLGAAGLGAAVVLNLVILAWLLVRAARARFMASLKQNQRNQRAILRLLDELSTLADGDLTMHATVTEDITGAIADSVNSAIDALRNLVVTINATAEDVARAANRTQSTAVRLAAASEEQAREITSANTAVTEMAQSMERVSGMARETAEVAMRSVTVAASGAETVRRSIAGMDTIREQIQETSKRIKRLGESSQEIGEIIGVINDIAEQTNILALNAAIQASSAGETGRGFAVVADEVQRLAERASDATRQVEDLIRTIQTDTSEAVASMEQSTTGVVSGARLAEDAGDALGEIESVSQQIADLIQRISQEAEQQAEAATGISERMNVIQDITRQTADGTSETASSIGELNELSQQLRKTVTGFKLPDDAARQSGSGTSSESD